jgi:membrane protease subunit HflK
MKANQRPLLIVLFVAATLIIGKQCFFQLEPEEEAIVLRLGKPLPETFESGLHTRIPFVDQVYKVPVHTQHRMEFGFRSGDKASGRTSGTQAESLMLTGDLMLVHVRWSLVYKIEDIHTWLFEIKDRGDTIRDISMGVMRQIVGDYSLDEVLTTKQLEIASLAQDTTQSALRDKVPTGVVITEVAIKSADVPDAARKAFDDLTRTLAKVQGELAVAKAEQDNVIGMARNEKNESIGIAERNHTEVIDNANGEAVAFLAKAAEYERAPEITRQWMYLNTMTIVLSGLDEKLVIEDGSGSGIAKHLPLKDFFSPAPQASSSGGAK